MAGPPALLAGRTVRKRRKRCRHPRGFGQGVWGGGEQAPPAGDDPRDEGHQLVRVLSPGAVGGR
jgi:hypothetical protein